MAIYGIEGGIGSGKTLTLVYLGLKDFHDGKKLYSNIKLKKVSGVKYLTKEMIKNMFEQVKTKKINLTNSTILLQEMHNYLDSRNSSSTQNKMLSYFILQSRHTGKNSCDIIYDTQKLGQVDKRLRNNTDYIIHPSLFDKEGNFYQSCSKFPPYLCKVEILAQVRQNYIEGNFTFLCSDLVNKYDTHELVDF